MKRAHCGAQIHLGMTVDAMDDTEMQALPVQPEEDVKPVIKGGQDGIDGYEGYGSERPRRERFGGGMRSDGPAAKRRRNFGPYSSKLEDNQDENDVAVTRLDSWMISLGEKVRIKRQELQR